MTNRIVSDATQAKADLTELRQDVVAEIEKFQSSSDASIKKASDELRSATTKLLEDTQAKVEDLQATLEQRSSETIEANQGKTRNLVEDLAKLKEQIKEQIQQATGFRLFGAFQSRQNEIVRAKNIWAYAVGTLVCISAGVTIWIAHEAQSYSANSFAFWVKLSLTIPLAFAITFCTVQYNRERRLEEEYAFKSSISVSLNPYRELVQSILTGTPEEASKYSEFVIDTVRNVFRLPLTSVRSATEVWPDSEDLKQTAEIIGTAVKAAK